MHTIKTAIILANLGTPDEPTAPAIKRYLAEFLSDPRVVNLPRSIWLPILHGVILKTRPKKLTHNYSMIWGTHDGPIRNITAALTRRVAKYFKRKYPERDLNFYTAMTYGNPAIKSILNQADLCFPAGLDCMTFSVSSVGSRWRESHLIWHMAPADR